MYNIWCIGWHNGIMYGALDGAMVHRMGTMV